MEDGQENRLEEANRFENLYSQLGVLLHRRPMLGSAFFQIGNGRPLTTLRFPHVRTNDGEVGIVHMEMTVVSIASVVGFIGLAGVACRNGLLLISHHEDLAKDPIGQIRAIYEKLNLGDFEKALPALQQHVDSLGEYKTNRYELDEATRAKITQRWGRFFRRYGYLEEPAEVGK